MRLYRLLGPGDSLEGPSHGFSNSVPGSSGVRHKATREPGSGGKEQGSGHILDWNCSTAWALGKALQARRLSQLRV